MHLIARIAVILVGLFSLLLALTAVAAPDFMAEIMGFPDPTPLGMSTIRGDLTAFFGLSALASGGAILAGKIDWLWAAVLLYGVTALGRTISWIVDGGGPGIGQSIIVEVVVAVVLVLSARVLKAGARR